MSEWPEVALSEVFEIARGGSPRPIDAFVTDSPDGINWVTISDASEGSKYITRTKRRIRRDGVSRSREVKPGDFLLTNSMSFGRPYIMRTSGCIHDGWLMLSPRRDDVDADFFYHLLGSKRLYSEFERLAAGATVKNLNIDLVRSVKVVLPPLAEQRRIAAILDKADELRARRLAALEKLNGLTQAIFLAMFGDPATNPKGWATGSVGDVVLSATYGTSSKAGSVGGLPILRMGNITAAGELDRSDLKFIDLEPHEIEKYTVRVGDVLFNRTNSPDLVGKTAIVRSTEPTAFAGYLIRLRVNDHNNPEYLWAFLNTAYAKRVLRGMCKTIIGMANINATEIQQMKIPLPPVALQAQFASIVCRVEGQKGWHRQSSAQLDALFATLQSRAFNGAL